MTKSYDPKHRAHRTTSTKPVKVAESNAKKTVEVEDATASSTGTSGEPRTETSSEAGRKFALEDAGDVEIGEDTGVMPSLQRLSVREGESAFVRFFTRTWVTLLIHFSIPDDDGGQATIACNGPGCVLCQAKFSPTRYAMLPVFSTDEQAIRVLQFGRKGGPGSLVFQVQPLLKKPDFTDYVYQVSKGRRLFVVKHFAKLGEGEDDDRDFGDDVLRELTESGQLPTPDSVAGTIPSVPNAEIVENFSRVARRLRQFGPRA